MSKRASTRIAHAGPRNMKDASDSDDDEGLETKDDTDDEASDKKEIVAVTPKKRVKKQAPKPQPLDAVLGGAVTTPQRRKKAGPPIVIDQGQLTLLELLVKHPDAAAAAAKLWVEKYRQQPVLGTADLLSLVVQVAGACVVVTEEDVEEGDTDSLAQRLAESVTQEGGCDPLHDRRTARTLPAAFATFCTRLMTEMDEAELLAGSADDFALDKLLHTVMSLSSSNIRPFRLAATLCASCLVDGLVEARKKRAEALSTAQFQLDSEAKKGKAASQSLLKSLKQTVDSYQRQSDVLSNHITELIKTVFAVRFRDKQAEVRARVIFSFGHWVATEPAAFLVDMHLKYLGWALSDQEAIVRFNAVNAVLKLYQETSNVQGLRDFKGRFLERMKELPYDVNEEVAIKGLALLARLVALKEVEAAQVQDMAALLSDESAPIRAAAAEVMAGVLAAQVEARVQELESARDEQAKGSTGARSRGQAAKAKPVADVKAATKQAEVVVLLDLMAWLQPGDQDQVVAAGSVAAPPPPLEEEVIGLLVDSLYDRYPVLHDVGHLATMLGSADMVEGKLGGPAGAAHLAALLAHVVKRMQGSDHPGSTGAKTGRAGAKKKAATTNQQQEFTQTLMGLLPNLIRQYQTEPAMLAPLLRVAGSLQLEVFAMQGEERALGALLALVAEQLSRHTDAGVLQEAAECLVAAATSGPGSLRAAAQLALSSTVSKVGTGLASSAKGVFQLSHAQLAAQLEELAGAGGEAATEVPEGAEVLWRLKASLLRCCALLTRGTPQLSSHAGVRDALARLLKEAGTGTGAAGTSRTANGPRALGADILGLALVASQAALMSDLSQMGVSPSAGDNAAAVAVPPSPAAAGPEPDKAAEETPTGKGKGAKKQPAKKKPTKRKGRKGKTTEEEEEEEEEEIAEEGEGGAAGRAPEEAAKQLAQAVQAHAATLLGLFDVCESDGACRELVTRAISDLLLLFGHETWKGTAAERARVPEKLAQELMWRCWGSCIAVLDQAREEEATLANQDPDEEAIDARVAEAVAVTRTTLAARRVLALTVPVRLLLVPAALAPTQRAWLATHVLAQLASHGAEAQQLIREVVVMLRRQQQQGAAAQAADGAEAPDSPAALPPLDSVPPMADRLLGALQLAYEDVHEQWEAQEQAEQEAMTQGATEVSPEYVENLEAALNRLQLLAQEIAGLYAVHGIHRDEVVGLARRAVSWVLTCPAPRPRMYLLAWGLSHLVPKLTPTDARLLAAEVRRLAEVAEQVAPRHVAEDGSEEEVQDPNWVQVDHFLMQLEERAAKGATGGGRGRGRARGAMKGSRAAAAKAEGRKGRGGAAAAGPEVEEEEAAAELEGAGGERSARKRARPTAQRKKAGFAADVGGEGEEEEEERPRVRARFAHTAEEEDAVVEEQVAARPSPAQRGAQKKAVGRGASKAKAAAPAQEGWHAMNRTSPAKRGAAARTATVPIASPAATSSDEGQGERDQEDQRPKAARVLFGALQSQPISEDQQLPRLPAAPGSATRSRARPAVGGSLEAATPSQASGWQGEGTQGRGSGGFQAATPSQGAGVEEEEGEEGGSFQSTESDGEGDEGEESEEGGQSMGAAPSESTQLSEPPPRVVKRRRV